jgi:pimeloyl-ACP methyl ester carboxylesterase
VKHLTRDGVKLAYEERGSGTGYPIVFVHGWTCDRTYFAPQAEHFSKTRRCVSIDLRGHGESDKPEGPYSISGFADDVAWMTSQLGLEQPVVVGHSMGGETALLLAAEHPSVPAAIVMVDAPVVPPEALLPVFGEYAEKFSKPDWRIAHRAFLEAFLFTPDDDPKLRERVLAQMTSAPDHVTLGCWSAIIGADTRGAASKCKVPALYVAADAWLADAHALKSLCPQVRVGQTVGAGHFHQLVVPDQVNAMIERFLHVSGV